ncbi:MAG: hypothetical protein E7348_01960 [Clostridiales bacterium]|nr:hypothetical protein [Clostridiales bacterium]
MANRGTKEGDIQEINDVKYINSHKEEFLEYFDKFNSDIKNLWMVRVCTNQFSTLTNKIVKTRADAFLISVKCVGLQEYVSLNKYLDEEILKQFLGQYDKVLKSGVSIKLDDSKKYQILKCGPSSFVSLFGNYELGAGASLFCMREEELIKNNNLLTGWNTSTEKMYKYFSALGISQKFIKNKQDCEKVKTFALQEIKRLVDSSKILQQKIFNGIGVYEEPYSAYYFLQNNKIEELNYINFSVTTGSGRSHGDYTIVLKPKGK